MPKPTCSLPHCNNQRRTRGLCTTHDDRFKKYGEEGLLPKPTLQDRFWAKVNKTDTCWEWTAYVNPDGYGSFQTGKRPEPAHRLAYRWLRRPIVEGENLDHLCHNRKCVNPDHLRAVKQKLNAENRRGANSNNKSSGVRGVYPEGRKWKAQVCHHGKAIRVGVFETIQEAESAVTEARKSIFTKI